MDIPTNQNTIVQENSNNNPPPSALPAPKKPSKVVSIIIATAGLVVVLLLIGGGAALAGRVYDPEWNPFRPSPAKVIASFIAKAQGIKSVHSTSKMQLQSTANQATVSVDLMTDSDVTDLQNPKAAGQVFVAATQPNTQNSMYAKVDYRVIGRNIYYNITDLNAPSLELFFAILKINIDDIRGNWIKFSPAGQPANLPNSQDQAAMKEKIKSILAKYTLYNFKKKLPDETINGQKIYHYLVSLNNDNLSKAVGDIIEQVAVQNPSPSSSSANSWLIAGAAKGAFSSFLDKLGEIDIDLGIGSKDSYLYDFHMHKKIDLSIFRPNATDSITIDATINNSQFNQPLDIQAPQTYKNFQDLFPAAKVPAIPGTKKSVLPSTKNKFPALLPPNYWNAGLLSSVLRFFH